MISTSLVTNNHLPNMITNIHLPNIILRCKYFIKATSDWMMICYFRYDMINTHFIRSGLLCIFLGDYIYMIAMLRLLLFLRNSFSRLRKCLVFWFPWQDSLHSAGRTPSMIRRFEPKFVKYNFLKTKESTDAKRCA